MFSLSMMFKYGSHLSKYCVLFINVICEVHNCRMDLQDTVPLRPNISHWRPKTTSRLSTSYLLHKTASTLTNNACDKRKVDNGAPNAHSTCHAKCLAIKTDIRDFYRTNPDNQIAKDIFDKFGSVHTGMCAYFRPGSYYPICWCYSSDKSKFGGQRRTPLFLCRNDKPVTRGLTRKRSRSASPNDENAHQRSQTGKRSASFLESGAWTGFTKVMRMGADVGNAAKGEYLKKDPGVLIIQMETSGNKIEALLDTGSGFTMISKKIAKNSITLEQPIQVATINEHIEEYTTEATIEVQVREGVTIAVTGLVTSAKLDLLLGNDFNVKYKSKINILKRTMEISIGKTKEKLSFDFLNSDRILFLNPHSGFYAPLKISANINGHVRKICIDTGSSSSVVQMNFVSGQKIRRMKNVECYAESDNRVRILGATDLKLWIENYKFVTKVLVVPSTVEELVIMGNSFNKQYVELIDFAQLTVTLRFPGSLGQIITPAFITN